MLKGVAGEAMQRQFASLHESERLEQALAELDRIGVNVGFVIGDDNRWLGLVRRHEIERQVAASPPDRPTVGELASPEIEISPSEPLPDALEAMTRRRLHGLPVVEDGILVGVLSLRQTKGFLALAERLDFPLSDVVDEISPDDDMFNGNLSVYLRTGASGLECVRHALSVAGRSLPPRRILDLGCGHGRVLRFLKAAFPQAGLTACDIDSSAIEFCADVLGAEPVASNRELADLPIHGTFDLIWSGSLFTHIDEEAWSRSLSLCRSLLDDSGVLVFSAAGPWCAERLRRGDVDYALDASGIDSLLEQYEDVGFGYVDYPNRQRYGISISTPEWVARVVESRASLRVLSHDERAFDAHQDVVVAVPI
jgi:CBS domain-containing protein/SAM-dependent methyltransferase